MSGKQTRPRLSKGILEMKFMQRSKAKVDKEIEEAEGREMYSQEITQKMLNSKSSFVMEPSFVHCENLIEGRLSFRGMNPEIERLLELEHAEQAAAKRHDQSTDVSDKEMAAFYSAQRLTMQKKFQTKVQSKTQQQKAKKLKKFQKPIEDNITEMKDYDRNK